MIPEIVLYLLKVNLAMLMFYLGYRLLLKRYTFYIINRYYLLTGIIYSVLYPLLDWSALLKNTGGVEKIREISPDWQGSIQYIVDENPMIQSDVWRLLIIMFWVGSSVMLLRFLTQMLSLYMIHRGSKRSEAGPFTFRKVNEPLSPFSFWKSIYLNPACHPSSEIYPILQHEQIHVEQLHTIDVIFSELCTIFNWFNPGVWLMRNAIKANLEFITDQEVIKRGVNKKDYQYVLLRMNTLEAASLPVNNFKILSLKQRINMINKKPSNRINLGSYLLIFPAILFFLSVVSVSQAALHPETARVVKAALPKVPEIVEMFVAADTIPARSSSKSRSGSPSTQDPEKVVTVTGKPISIILRGDSVNNSARKPLYILDGKEMKRLDDVDPQDIESVSVLKGAQATRLYGRNAEDGAVVISTKGRALFSSDTTVAGKKGMLTVTGYASSNGRGNLNEVVVIGRAAGSGQRETLTLARPQSSQNISLSDLDNPLYIINGKESKKSDLDNLPASKISSIEVIKGKNARDLYGDKGENGVIRIITK